MAHHKICIQCGYTSVNLVGFETKNSMLQRLNTTRL
jgi:hypothetical protein